MATFSLILLILGGFICCLNFYLSFLRYALYRMLGGVKGSYKWTSGFPLIGSLLVAISLLTYRQNTWILAAAIILIAIDTGGIHWFIGTVLYRSIFKKRK